MIPKYKLLYWHLMFKRVLIDIVWHFWCQTDTRGLSDWQRSEVMWSCVVTWQYFPNIYNPLRTKQQQWMSNWNALGFPGCTVCRHFQKYSIWPFDQKWLFGLFKKKIPRRVFISEFRPLISILLKDIEVFHILYFSFLMCLLSKKQ